MCLLVALLKCLKYFNFLKIFYDIYLSLKTDWQSTMRPPPSPLQVTLLKCLPSLLPSSLNSEILATGFDIQRLSMDLAKWLL